MGAALMHLVPKQEYAPGAVAAIKNQVVNSLIDKASQELSLRPEQLVARDIRSYEDLWWCKTDSVVATEDDWLFTTTTINTWESISDDDRTMADERFVAIWGLRDMWMRTQMDTDAVTVPAISLVRITVGGATKTIWDLGPCGCYAPEITGICPSAIIIPQNASFLFEGYVNAAATAIYLMPLGIVCEPRGKLISP